MTMVLYTLGLMHSIFGFYRKRQVFVTVALVMVGCGFASHTVYLLLLGFQVRHLPITNLSESLSFFAWCITLTFIAAHLRYRTNVLGAFVLPLVSLLMILSELIWEGNHTIPPLLKSRWIYFHAVVAFLAYAAFFLTFVSSILYLIQEKELKAKNFRFLYFRLPSLQMCDELLRRSLYARLFLNEHHDNDRRSLGAAGMGPLLELGPKGDSFPGNLGHLPGAGQLPAVRRLAWPLGLLYQHRRVRVDAVHVRNQQGVAYLLVVFFSIPAEHSGVWPACLGSEAPLWSPRPHGASGHLRCCGNAGVVT